MKSAPKPPSEARRLAVLEEYAIVDTLPEAQYDNLARLAGLVCNTPIAVVGLIDGERQWFKSKIGFEACEAPRDLSFCAYTILDPENVFIIEDTLKDNRFSDHPMVTDDPRIRFYAGSPLVTPSGEVVGALCVMDKKPRVLSSEQIDALKILACQVVTNLELRKNFVALLSSEKIMRERENSLEESRFFLKNIIDSVADPVFVKDDQFRFIRGNTAFWTLFGKKEEEVVGKTDYDFFPKDQCDVFRQKDQEVFTTGYNENLEQLTTTGGISHTLVTKKRAFVGLDGHKVLVGVIRDVTEELATKRKLLESEALFRLVTDTVPNIVFMTDLTRAAIFLNKTWYDFSGRTPEQDLGFGWGEIVHPDDIGPLMRTYNDAFELQKPYTAEMRIKRHDGKYRTFMAKFEPRFNDDGLFEGYVGACTDITERKEAERAKDEFISIVSHELRTPMTSIHGSLGLMTGKMAGDMPDEVQQLANIAYSNSERLIRLVNDILDINKIVSGDMHLDMKAEFLSSLVMRTVEENRAYADKFGVSIIVEEVAPRIAIKVNADRMIQILSNLLSNAAKFSPRGSDIVVSVSSAAGKVRVAVRDSGPGIPKDFYGRIFTKFSQADSSATRKKGGSGLGLYISKEIAERMGGRIGFDEGVEMGSVFWVEFPDVSAYGKE